MPEEIKPEVTPVEKRPLTVFDKLGLGFQRMGAGFNKMQKSLSSDDAQNFRAGLLNMNKEFVGKAKVESGESGESKMKKKVDEITKVFTG